jgi:hypothetical protein
LWVVYVKGIANGDPEIILAAGLDLAQPRGPSPAMTKVEGLVLSAGGNGQVLSDAGSPGARAVQARNRLLCRFPFAWLTPFRERNKLGNTLSNWRHALGERRAIAWPRGFPGGAS